MTDARKPSEKPKPAVLDPVDALEKLLGYVEDHAFSRVGADAVAYRNQQAHIRMARASLKKARAQP